MRQSLQLFLSVFALWSSVQMWSGGSLQAADTTGPQPLPPSEILNSKEIEIAKAEIERVAELVKAGALPRVRLEESEAKLADAQDEVILADALR